MPVQQQLSRRSATLLGLVFIAAGGPPILIGSGAIAGTLTPGTPGWVGVAAGLLFVCTGAAVIVGFAVAGGAAPDGDLPAATPLALRAMQCFLGFCIVGLLLAITSWIAFGSGERHFSSTTTWPFGATSNASSERVGRFMFGVAAIAIGIFWVAGTVVSVRRWSRAAAEIRDKLKGSAVGIPVQ